MSNFAKSISPILNVAAMLSPQTAWLAKANKIAGGLSAYGDAARAAKTAGALNATTLEELKRQGLLSQMAYDQYKKNEASGLYDPEKRVSKLYESFKVGTDYGSKGLTNSLLGSGYKPGDTPAIDSVNRFLGNRGADFALKADAVRAQTAQQQQEDLARAAGVGNPLGTAAMASNLAGNYGNAAGSGAEQLATILASLGLGQKKAPLTASPFTGLPVYKSASPALVDTRTADNISKKLMEGYFVRR